MYFFLQIPESGVKDIKIFKNVIPQPNEGFMQL